MEAAWLRTLRWRRRGAWLWPTFAAATLADAVIGHAWPAGGTGEAIATAAFIGLLLNTIAVVVLARPLALLVRRRRPDLPAVVARDYAGTATVSTVLVVLLAIGLLHHGTILHDRNALRDAISRAQAFIGDRAPPEFRSNVQWVDTYAIQPGSIYRACVPSSRDSRTYCVVVNTQVPFPRGVTFSGYEPNSMFSAGAW